MRTGHLAFVIALSALAVPGVTASTAVIVVDDDAAPGGNGSARLPYSKLEDAIAAANASLHPTIVKVRPGEYVLSGPLLIDQSVDLRGSSELIQDGNGWPTGEVGGGTETRIVAANVSGSQSLIVVGRSDATVLENVTIRGFVFQGSINGPEVLLSRVQNFQVSANVFRAATRS